METTGAPKPAITLARAFERTMGRTADGHLCVTKVSILGKLHCTRHKFVFCRELSPLRSASTSADVGLGST